LTSSQDSNPLQTLGSHPARLSNNRPVTSSFTAIESLYILVVILLCSLLITLSRAFYFPAVLLDTGLLICQTAARLLVKRSEAPSQTQKFTQTLPIPSSFYTK